uniref:Metalnikowin-2B n=1 Tax=Palomena prasina TaxID=55431 RepID=MK2B_PALPR|nr:RecName: Full=Metalnikowin-2B; AltName: Full=Metalnikowin IIB [Palomena prasina]
VDKPDYRPRPWPRNMI